MHKKGSVRITLIIPNQQARILSKNFLLYKILRKNTQAHLLGYFLCSNKFDNINGIHQQ